MFNDFYNVSGNTHIMEMLLSVLCMVLCNKIPKGVVPFKTDGLAAKIRLVQPPRGMELVDRTAVDDKGNVTQIAKNTNDRAVIRILVPKRKMTPSEIDNEGRNSTLDAGRST